MNFINPSIHLPSFSEQYKSADAYPHISIDHFLDQEWAKKVFDQFPKIDTEEWTNYTHFNEKKYGNSKLDSFPPAVRQTVEYLNSDSFVEQLSILTGIPNLLADEELQGGGLHQTPQGGFLNIHADFTVHPHHNNWKRRVNLIIYLNENYEEEWGGELEIWDRKMTACSEKIPPTFNRAVIFNTDLDTFHGHPEPYNCPKGESRKSLALYYFTEEDRVKIQSTEYRAKPTESTTKKTLVWLDKMLLRVYDRVKRITGMDDKLASKILGWFSKK